MLSKIRNSLFIKVICGLLSFYFLNISVDSPDPNPEYISENLQVNDQESLIELVLEKIIGLENVIDEYDDKDSEEHNTKKGKQSIDVYFQSGLQQQCKYFSSIIISQSFPIFSDALNTGYLSIINPPPKF